MYRQDSNKCLSIQSSAAVHQQMMLFSITASSQHGAPESKTQKKTLVNAAFAQLEARST